MHSAGRPIWTAVWALALSCVVGGALGIPTGSSGMVPKLAGGVGQPRAGAGGVMRGGTFFVPGLTVRKEAVEGGFHGGVEALRGGGFPKKLGGKNVGLLIILLSLLYLPRAMSQCSAMLVQPTKMSTKVTIKRLGCGPGLSITNIITLSGLAMVLVNSNNFDRFEYPLRPPLKQSRPQTSFDENQIICGLWLTGTGGPS